MRLEIQSEADPFDSRLGFAASEAGQRKRGRELLERALDIRPQSLYSIHGLAHMLHDEGAAEESTRVLQDWLKLHEAGAREGQNNRQKHNCCCQGDTYQGDGTQCAALDDKCTTAGDCCDKTQVCIAGFCGLVQPG